MSEVARQLAAAGIRVFPCTSDKKPAVGKGVDWRDVATTATDSLSWPSGVVGVPVPPGATVIDLDTYKGVTRQQVEQMIGCALPWDAALIQRTQNGGEHYAFSAAWDVKQGSDLYGLEGFDTRCAGKGYIATGDGYQWAGNGLYGLAYPGAMLPALPDAARPALERTQTQAPEAAELPEGDRDVDVVREALRYVNADCPRSEWVLVGMGLKHHFHDTPDVGFALFKEWSEYASERLDYETLEPQWESFKPMAADGATVTIASVIYKAMQNGYTPPSDINTALAFGADAAPIEVMADLYERIQEGGGDPRNTDALVREIQTLQGSTIQRSGMLALLQRELKEAGLLTKALRDDITPARTRAPGGMYGKDQSDNATMFLDRHFPGGTLVRSDQVWYRYTGACWEEVDDERLKATLINDMMGSGQPISVVRGTLDYITGLCHTVRKIGAVPGRLVIYENGVLDTETWMLTPHDPELFTTNILPYRYAPGAPCSAWVQFLGELFEGDQERIDLLQEWFGYLMSPSYRFHKIMLLLGPPRSGKGTVGRVLEMMAGGQNFSGGSLHAFASDKFLDSLRTKPVMFVGDAEQKVSRNHIGTIIERMKTISGNDAITFDRIYKKSLTETLPTRITIAANHTPSLFDDSGALAGRFLVLPINVTFSGRENVRLFEALSGEIGGIAAWAMSGLYRLNAADRFTSPKASEDEAQYVAETYSPLMRFIDEVCLGDSEAVTYCDDMHDAYRAWAVVKQEDHVLPRRTFTSAFKDATRGRFRYGPQRQGDKVERGFKGVRLRAVESATSVAFAPTIVK